MKRLSAHILVTNPDTLSRCLTSLFGITESIFILTPQLNQQLATESDNPPLENQEKIIGGTTVIRGETIEETRNNALKQTNTDWIITLESDEVISQPRLTKLKQFLEEAEEDAYILPIHQFTNRQELSGWKPSTKISGYSGVIEAKGIRVFRMYNTIQYEQGSILQSLNRIHATIKEITDIPIHKYSDVSDELTENSLLEQHQLNPQDKKIQYNLGKQYLYSKKWDKAHDILKNLAEEGYENSMVQDGVALLNLHRQADAAIRFLAAIKKDEKNVSAYNNLAAIFSMKKEYTRAASLYQKALSIDRTDARLFHALITVYIALEKRKEALRLLIQARKIHPRHPQWKELEKMFTAEEMIG